MMFTNLAWIRFCDWVGKTEDQPGVEQPQAVYLALKLFFVQLNKRSDIFYISVLGEK